MSDDHPVRGKPDTSKPLKFFSLLWITRKPELVHIAAYDVSHATMLAHAGLGYLLEPPSINRSIDKVAETFPTEDMKAKILAASDPSGKSAVSTFVETLSKLSHDDLMEALDAVQAALDKKDR